MRFCSTEIEGMARVMEIGEMASSAGSGHAPECKRPTFQWDTSMNRLFSSS